MAGKFIVIEGPDRSGKSTLSNSLNSVLENRGFKTYLTHEPTDFMDQGLNILKQIDRKQYFILLGMFLRDRNNHNEKILEMLGEDRIVICDRYSLSTLAYQGVYFKNHFSDPEEFIKWMETTLSICHLRPDMTLFLSLNDPLSRKVNELERKLTTFENGGYLEDVNRMYHEAIKRKIFFDPGHEIDASLPKNIVLDNALKILEKVL